MSTTNSHRHRGSAGRVTDSTARQTEAVRLRLSGANYQQIADALGVNRSTAWRAVDKALKAERFEAVAELRQIELARLDQVLSTLWPKATRGDLQAVDRVLNTIHLQAKLTGMTRLFPEDEGSAEVRQVLADFLIVTRDYADAAEPPNPTTTP
ncbi:MAG: helix-turn-helix domain-containing protein [Microbacteriaceae bacterium]|nr:helix-turn-helix domain-containing protein [Microbacteriaceae bacterium]MCL2795023.1 helix-turn-helix domain-containing protein [Microbacteriaceae bacterium]